MERVVAEVDGLAESLTDAETLTELAVEEDDPSALAEAAGELAGLRERIASLEEESLFFGEHDDRPAIVGVHAGAGGVDAQDWAEMMLRMYVRYLEESGFEVGVDEVSPGEQAGIKSASLTVEGEYAYGRMEGERGVHRLVRISPYDANSRRHTSFAGVDVVPLVEDAQVDLNMEEVRVDTYRSQGAGPACQHHRLGGAPHPSSHRDRGGLPGGALPAPEPGPGRHPADSQTGRAGPDGAPPGVGPNSGGADRGRLGTADTILRAGPLSAGERSAHRMGDGEHRRRARRLLVRFHRRLSAVAPPQPGAERLRRHFPSRRGRKAPNSARRPVTWAGQAQTPDRLRGPDDPIGQSR